MACIHVTVEGEELSKDLQSLGYPRQHRHKLATLRQELIDAFVEYVDIYDIKHTYISFASYNLGWI